MDTINKRIEPLAYLSKYTQDGRVIWGCQYRGVSLMAEQGGDSGRRTAEALYTEQRERNAYWHEGERRYPDFLPEHPPVWNGDTSEMEMPRAS